MKPTVVSADHELAADVFFERYQRSAAALHAMGVGDGDVVALMLHNSPLNLELMLATRWLGAVWCPVNWHFKADEVHFILTDSDAKLFVCEDALLQALGPEVAPPGVRVVAASTWAALREAAPAEAPAAGAPRGPMLYTSGTTGRPKGIRRGASTPEQVALALERSRQVYGLEPGMRALLNAPMYHSAPNAYASSVAQMSGHLFLEPRFDAEGTLRLIEQHRITHAYLVPTMYVRLLRLPPEVRARYDISSMRFVASTGSPCPPDVKRAMIEWWGPVIYEAYGSSELGYMTLLNPHEALRKPGSAGRAIPGVGLRILDDDGNELPQGQAGLIYVKPALPPNFTYQGNDAARRAMEREGYLTMADVGYLDEDGYLFIVDRKADMVISGGVNIYPAEIEAALQAMPGIEDVAVFGIPDAEFGEALAAAVQPAATEAGAALTPASVRAWLHERIAGYKVPHVVTLHERLPREDTGKIFKRKLREPYWQGQARRI
ncbi:MAG: AMP-binding protein [Burkholderiales bacterium]|nr:AMP-binding protein [Burkholderiales bacterium]